MDEILAMTIRITKWTDAYIMWGIGITRFKSIIRALSQTYKSKDEKEKSIGSGDIEELMGID